MPTVDCETSEEYFYDSKQSLASKASEDSFHSANEEFFLPYDVRTDVRRFQLLTNLLAEVQNMRKMMLTVITVQAQVKSLSSYSKN